MFCSGCLIRLPAGVNIDPAVNIRPGNPHLAPLLRNIKVWKDTGGSGTDESYPLSRR